MHRRDTDNNAILHLHDRVDDHDLRFAKMENVIQGFAENVRQLNENMGRIASVLEFFRDLRGFWATLKLASTFAKVILSFAAVSGLVWGGFKFLVWLSGTGA